MRHMMKIGPVHFEDGETNAYLLFGSAGLDMTMAGSDAEGVKSLTGRAGPGTIVCEETLSLAATQHGLRVGRPPEEALAAKVALAVGLEHGPLLEDVKNLALILELIMATVDFERAEPWEKFLGDEAIELQIEGSRTTYEGCVMGQAGEIYGLALYKDRGAVARVVELSQLGREGDTVAFDTMSLLLDRENFAADAVAQLAGVRVAPMLMRLRRGEQLPLTEQEVMTMVAAMRAVVALARGEVGIGACREGKKPVRVRARTQGGGPADEDLPVAQSFQKVGRNDPCPCGSGEKYKRCHLGKLSVAPAAPRDESVHERDRRLVERLLAFGGERFGKEVLTSALSQAFGQRQVSAQLMGPLIAYDWPVQGKALSEHLLESTSNLPPADRQWLEAQRSAKAAVWEVLRVDRGAGFEALNLLSQRRVYVTEVSGSRTLLPRQSLLARLVDVPGGGRAVMIGSHEQPLPPREADEVVRKLRDTGGGRSEWGRAVELISLWDQRVGDIALKAASPAVVKNTDGHPLVEVEDTFAIAKGGFAPVLASLLRLDGAQVDQEDARGARLTFIRPGNPVHTTWKNTIVGSARITATKLSLRTNSVQRADELRARVTAAAGSSLTFKKRLEQPLPAMRGGAEMLMDAQANVSPEPRNFMRDWLDTSVPALSDRTPREAVRDETGRAEVHLLLKELELHHAVQPNEFLNPSRLRRELGLDELGAPARNAELDRALGFGRKVSETLLEFAAPLMDSYAPGRNDTELRAMLDFAALVWNLVAFEEQGASGKELDRARAELKPGRVPAQLLRHFDELVARKRARFAGDLRTIANISVSRQGGGLHVRAEARLPPDVIERAKKAGMTP